MRLKAFRSDFCNGSVRGKKALQSAALESLESRRLLTTTLVNGVLTVVGTAAGEDIVVTYDSPNQLYRAYVNNVQEASYDVALVTSVSVSGLAGHDEITMDWSGGVSASINGGDGNDTIIGSPENDTILGDLGGDSIYAMDGDDEIYCGDGNDVAFGGNGDDLLDGGNQNDIFYWEPGADTINGAGGKDLLDFTAATADLTITMDDISNDGAIGSATKNISSSNDTVLGGSGNDFIAGNGNANFIQGAVGNDTILGYGGADSLSGNGGNDSIDGGSGNDSLFGFAGNDYLNGSSNDDYIEGNAGYDTLIGSSGNDILHGWESQADTLDGGDGIDSVYRDSALDSVSNVEFFLN